MLIPLDTPADVMIRRSSRVRRSVSVAASRMTSQVELGDDGLELVGAVVGRLWFTLLLERGGSFVASQVFGVERLGADSVGVVELEQFAALCVEDGDLAASLRLEPAGGPPAYWREAQRAAAEKAAGNSK